MPNSLTKISKLFNIITLIGSLAILLTLSYQIIYLDEFTLSKSFINLQLIICLVFIIDFWLRFTLSDKKKHFFIYNFALLLVSVPILNILTWLKLDIPQHNYVIYRLMPLVRGIYGLVIVVRWITRRGIVSLTFSYMTTVLVFTYSASLLFYSLEQQSNAEVKNFGDALWWAAMNLTTIGSPIIIAQSTIGKILTVILSSLGMMMFPIFTAYIIANFEHLRKR